MVPARLCIINNIIINISSSTSNRVQSITGADPSLSNDKVGIKKNNNKKEARIKFIILSIKQTLLIFVTRSIYIFLTCATHMYTYRIKGERERGGHETYRRRRNQK